MPPFTAILHPTPGCHPLPARAKSGNLPDVTGWNPVPPGLSRNHAVKELFNHGWTQMNTDEELSEGRSGPVFRKPPNGALPERLRHHVLSVFICVHPWFLIYFTELLRLG
jgi:hypothetical protein